MKHYIVRTTLLLLGALGIAAFAPKVTQQRLAAATATTNSNNYVYPRTPSQLFFQDPKDELKSLEENPLHASKMEDSKMDEIAESNNTADKGIFSFLSQIQGKMTTPAGGGAPPLQIEDTPLLFYDIFLILNLSLSISFWVVHRMSFLDIIPAFSEGSLLCILWIVAGLLNGAFLYSAVDGHYDVSREEYADKGGPRYAALLGLSTMVTTANLRILVALVTAVVEHRHVGYHGEELIPLEIAFGLILMPSWRMLHSNYAMR